MRPCSRCGALGIWSGFCWRCQWLIAHGKAVLVEEEPAP